MFKTYNVLLSEIISCYIIDYNENPINFFLYKCNFLFKHQFRDEKIIVEYLFDE